MPNLDFYAVADDHRRILEFVWSCGEFRVFQLTSAPDQEIREFHAPPGPGDFQLLPIHSGGTPLMRRYELNPGALGDATFRFACEGWGLIQLFLRTPRDGQLPVSHTNHNSAARARAWAPTYPELGDPDLWDWRQVARASRRLNRHIQGLAVAKDGSRPVLPAAYASGLERRLT